MVFTYLREILQFLVSFFVKIFVKQDLPQSNCAWNPLIYISRSATYKKEIAKMLFFRLKNKATPKTDSNYNIPVPVQRIQRKLSIIAGIEVGFLFFIFYFLFHLSSFFNLSFFSIEQS